MKNYTTDSFRTRFAKISLQDDLDHHVRFDLLEQYQGTDIDQKIKGKFSANPIENMGTMFNTQSDITLSNGQTVTPHDAYNYAFAIQRYAAIQSLETLEVAFAETTDLEEIQHRLRESVSSEIDEKNLLTVMMSFPFEATHIYFETLFAEHIIEEENYQALTFYLDAQLGEMRVMAGPLINPIPSQVIINSFAGNVLPQIANHIRDNVLQLSTATNGSKPKPNNGPTVH